MKFDNLNLKKPKEISKIKTEEEKKPDDARNKSVVGYPAKTDDIIDRQEEKTLIKRRAKTAKLAEKNQIIENPDKSIVGFSAKTSELIEKPDKTLINTKAKTAKFAEEK